jgi:GNAT superfamily N-acetyltransferase
VNGVQFPVGFRLESLRRGHPRKQFSSGQPKVDDWLAAKALQQQEKHLSVSKVLIDAAGAIAGYYTLATGQVEFGALPHDLTRHLPKRTLPVAVLAWLGISATHQGQGLGKLLLAQALRDCHDAGRTFPFIAVILDCIDDQAKSFYGQWDFTELPGHPYRLFLSVQTLTAIIGGQP